MVVPSAYQIYSRRQQGLAETSRLILEFAGVEYVNVFVQDWEQEKETTPLQQLPVLRVLKADGQWKQISESHTMERFLSHTLGLMGEEPLEAAFTDMYHAAWTDMMSMFMWKVWRAPNDESKRQGASEFWVEFPKFLKKHDSILEKTDGPFYLGSRPHLPDIYSFTWLNRFITKWLPSPPELITEENYPHLWALWKGVRELDGIKSYIESGRWELPQ
ncbi:hypothetical protein BGW36DRAFT_84595 [Talaromyces proteolyticus]|uniref:GST N-terminal domain-containing protein n=1 Tax=Talaromyces proteolyticus TaxID=1131652 RepID=A0AAD4Q4H9_9EURO|nr:uncharacterized protein BGW36DRAFT_84595 [Talaromyces proteolyticus]KAH8703266.1 hypothetical protein BGW36DRAFT_84595 [Talaromyces proteolyticus]